MKKINTFRPLAFKSIFINNHFDKEIFKFDVEHFFIHSFRDDKVELRLPLPIHRKTVTDLMFVTKGQSRRQIGLTQYDLQAGDLLLVPNSSISNTELMSEDIEGYYCHFSDDFLGSSIYLKKLLALSEHQRWNHFDGAALERVKTLFTTIYELYRAAHDAEFNQLLIGSYLKVLLAELYHSVRDRNPAVLKKGAKLVEAYQQLIRLHYMRDWNVGEYAERLQVTPNHLNKTVKRYLHRSASDVLYEIKIQEAKVLLLQTNDSIAEIALQLGFDDSGYFGKFFKKHTGEAPAVYRKRIDFY